MSSTVIGKYYHIRIFIIQLKRPAWYWWSWFAMDRTKFSLTGFSNFSNHHTSNIPDLLNITVNLSLAYQTRCDDMFSDPESDNILSHFFVTYLIIFCFFLYVILIYLPKRGEDVGINCIFIPDWIISTRAQILFSCQMQNGDTEPN